MYKTVRTWHRWIGLLASFFLIIISITGFLLATKGTFGWIRPPEKDGAPLTTLSEVVSVNAAAEAAFAQGLPELKTHTDIDRIDYRPKGNVFKVVSKEGYHEVQVDGATGQVLQVARRNDQLAEDIHDLSFFADAAHDYGLPVIAVALFLLGLSGVCIFFVPVFRRWRFGRQNRMGTGTSA